MPHTIGNSETLNSLAQPLADIDEPNSSVLDNGKDALEYGGNLLTFPIVPAEDGIATSPDVEGISSDHQVSSNGLPSVVPVCDSSSAEHIQNFLCVKLNVLLPKKIHPCVLRAFDKLHQMLATTVEQNIQLYQPASRGKAIATLVDLTFPKSYADTLQNNESLVVAMFKSILSVIESISELVLPNISIKTLCHILESDIFQKETKCSSIKVYLTKSCCEEILKLLPQVIEHLVRLSPANIECFSDVKVPSTIVDFFKSNKAYKKKLVAILKPNGESAAIGLKFNDYAITKCKENNPRKRSVDPTSSFGPQSKNPKPQSEKKKPKKIPKYNLNVPTESLNNTFFTFDSLQLQPVIDTGDPFTAYSYWQLEKIHRIEGCTGAGTTVAIIDSGIDPSHPAFILKFNEGLDNYQNLTDDAVLYNAANSHGTLCAGIAAGSGFSYMAFNDSSEFAMEQLFPPGVAPAAQLMIYKVFPFGELEARCECVLQALENIYTRSDIDVVSLSLGSLKSLPQIRNAINDLMKEGIIVVCAASNHGHKYSQPISYPARLGNLLCIGSHGPNGKPSDFSPVGQEIDFLAPGENILGPSSAVTSHSIESGSGTSYAAPAVAGLICLILGFIKHYHKDHLHHFKDQSAMKEILKKISTSPGKHSVYSGFGALNPLQFFKHAGHVLDSVLTDQEA